MRHFVFLKSIIFMMMVSFAAVSANAQEVINGINTRDAKACMEYLVKNSKDTIASVSSFVSGEDTVVVRRSVFLAGEKLMARQDTTIYRPTVKSLNPCSNG